MSPRAHFKSDGDKDFFLEFRLLLHRFCLLDSLVVCIVVALIMSVCQAFMDFISLVERSVFNSGRYAGDVDEHMFVIQKKKYH